MASDKYLDKNCKEKVCPNILYCENWILCRWECASNDPISINANQAVSNYDKPCIEYLHFHRISILIV